MHYPFIILFWLLRQIRSAFVRNWIKMGIPDMDALNNPVNSKKRRIRRFSISLQRYPPFDAFLVDPPFQFGKIVNIYQLHVFFVLIAAEVPIFQTESIGEVFFKFPAPGIFDKMVLPFPFITGIFLDAAAYVNFMVHPVQASFHINRPF